MKDWFLKQRGRLFYWLKVELLGLVFKTERQIVLLVKSRAFGIRTYTCILVFFFNLFLAVLGLQSCAWAFSTFLRSSFSLRWLLLVAGAQALGVWAYSCGSGDLP